MATGLQPEASVHPHNPLQGREGDLPVSREGLEMLLHPQVREDSLQGLGRALASAGP